jgi:hypothetical protein
LRPGRSIEHEPVDRAERISQHIAQNATACAENGQDDDQDGGQQPVAFNHAATASAIRSALRPGAFWVAVRR